MGDVVQGTVAPGFEPVREAFERCFREHGEVGASVCVVHEGREVVHLWGGEVRPGSGEPYGPDTLQLVFSSTKGIVAMLAHLYAQRGQLDLDAPVARWWPEFAAAGKEQITVRHLLSHQAGLVGVDEPLTIEELCAWDPFVERLAAQAPYWAPGTAHGYHAITYGHLVGEVLRRLTGKGVGQQVREEIAGPLGVDIHVGVPDDLIPSVAPLLDFPPPEPGADVDPVFVAIFTPGSLTNRAFTVAPVLPTTFNQPELLAAEIPAANGVMTARSLARAYAACVSEVDGFRLLSEEQVEDARKPQSVGEDLVLLSPDEIGSGFFLPDALSPLLGPGSFGHGGLGGSLGCALPERRLALGYAMNQCLPAVKGDPRNRLLIDAVLACTE